MEQSLPKKDNQMDDILNAPSSTFVIDFNNPHSDVIIDFAKKVLELCNVFAGNKVRFEIIDSNNSDNKIPVEIVSVNDGSFKTIGSYKGKAASRISCIKTKTIQIFKEKIDLLPSDLAKIQCFIWSYFFANAIIADPFSEVFLIADKSTFDCLIYNKFLEDKKSLSEFFNNFKQSLPIANKPNKKRVLRLESLIFKNEEHG